jgi:Flp pilus assembly protein TadD
MSVPVSPFAPRRFSSVLALAGALALGACQNKSAEIDDLNGVTTASTNAAAVKSVQRAAKAWESDPDDPDKAIAYADQLDGLGATDRKLAVLKRTATANPKSQRLQAAYGKALAESGRLPEATQALEAASSSGNQDWKTYSALGSTYDQQGRHDEARIQYERALKLSPDEASVLNNLGMSHALSGNLKMAEETLRKAFATPGGRQMPRLRQNLALVVGLQGRFDEARDIASKDLPAAQVEENMKFLQSMLNQPNTWQQLKKDG